MTDLQLANTSAIETSDFVLLLALIHTHPEPNTLLAMFREIKETQSKMSDAYVQMTDDVAELSLSKSYNKRLQERYEMYQMAIENRCKL